MFRAWVTTTSTLVKNSGTLAKNASTLAKNSGTLAKNAGWGVCLLSLSLAHADSPAEDRFRAVLQEASSPSPDWKALFRDAQRVRRLDPDDPRGDHVLAVAHMRKREFDPAERYFLAAKDRPQGIYFPAWKGLILLRLWQQDGDEAIGESVSLADSLLDDDTAWLGLSSAPDAAQFLGRVVAFLELPETEWGDAETVRRLMAPFEGRVSGERFHAYHAGRRALSEEHHELQLRIAAAASRHQDRLREKTEAKSQELRAQRDEAEDSQETLNLTKQELKNRLEKEWDDTGRLFLRVQQDHESVTQAAIHMLSLIDRTMTELDRVATLAGRGLTGQPIRRNVRDERGVVRPDRFIATHLFNLEFQLAGYQRRFEALNVQAEQLARQANGLIARRQQVAQQYQSATGQLLAKDREIQRRMDALRRAEQGLERQAVASSAAGRLDSRLASPATFFEIDWAKELEHLPLANGSNRDTR